MPHEVRLTEFLPKFAIIDSAKDSDPAKAYEVCSGIKEGEEAEIYIRASFLCEINFTLRKKL